MIDKLVGPSSKSVSPETGSKENEDGSDGATVLMKSPSKGSKKVDVKKRN